MYHTYRKYACSLSFTLSFLTDIWILNPGANRKGGKPRLVDKYYRSEVTQPMITSSIPAISS